MASNGHRVGDFALLDGETREWTAADAEHWTGVYRELIRFAQQVIADSGAAEGEAMTRRLAHLERRLAFWESGLLTKA
ncbi:MAG: hypothetical protein ABI838_02335 [Chloroflexota bacterium]